MIHGLLTFAIKQRKTIFVQNDTVATDKFVEFERKMLMTMEELKSAVAQNTRILQVLQASSIATADIPDVPGDIQLPVATVRDLQVLNDRLHDDELLVTALVSNLVHILACFTAQVFLMTNFIFLHLRLAVLQCRQYIICAIIASSTLMRSLKVICLTKFPTRWLEVISWI